jgi:hypothetical protein
MLGALIASVGTFISLTGGLWTTTTCGRRHCLFPTAAIGNNTISDLLTRGMTAVGCNNKAIENRLFPTV